MRRKRLILLFGLGVLAAGVILCLPRGPKEPVFEGQKLGYWIRKSLDSVDPQIEEQAERAVKAAGTNALPYLMDQFTRRPSRWARTMNQVSSRFGTSFHAETEDERISVGDFGLSALGPDVAPALPMLANELSDPRRHAAAATLMSQCGDKALPFIRKMIQSTNTVLSLLSLSWVSRNGEVGAALIEKLLADPDSGIRLKTVLALSHSGSGAKALNRALEDSEAEVQIASAQALGSLESAAQLAVPRLLTLVTNSNERLARAASNAVQRIDPSAMPLGRPQP